MCSYQEYDLDGIIKALDLTLDKKEISSLITFARQIGIGKPLSYQKTLYCNNDLQKLKTLISIWEFINKSTETGFRDNETKKGIQKILSKVIYKNTSVVIYSVFCPSYKKGIGSIGYSGSMGEHTKKIIGQISFFVKGLEEKGINVEVYIFFSDLLLENYSKIKATDYKKDLNDNFLSFKKEFNKYRLKNILIKKLSSQKFLDETIGEKGATSKFIDINNEIFKIVLERNKVFYKTILGWCDKDILNRTKILFLSYGILGKYLKSMFPDGIMFWTESQYERGLMYKTQDGTNLLPIIYPLKDE